MCMDAERISGCRLGDEPALFWQPWVGHWCHLTPDRMSGVHVHQYVGMYDWVKAQT